MPIIIICKSIYYEYKSINILYLIVFCKNLCTIQFSNLFDQQSIINFFYYNYNLEEIRERALLDVINTFKIYC